jgi:two-component system chemotaxis response regulator CheB
MLRALRPYRVLIVDDSALVRRLIKGALQSAKDIEVVGSAADPYQARDMINQLKPDILTLDIEMPRMDGLTFLKIIMEQCPMPVIIVSSLSQKNSTHTIQALSLGAADVLGKPAGAHSLGKVSDLLQDRIRGILSSERHFDRVSAKPDATAKKSTSRTKLQNNAIASKGPFHPQSIGLIGASTGGTIALRKIFENLPSNAPGMCIVQHMPEGITKAFAESLNSISQMTVLEAKDGDYVEHGLALVAPGNYHMLLMADSNGYRVKLKQSPKVWYQRPAVDVLFKSAASVVSHRAVATVLTGMGRDGAEGLLKLKSTGAATIAQDAASSTVYGMPKAAYELGAAKRVLSLEAIATSMLQLFRRSG